MVGKAGKSGSRVGLSLRPLPLFLPGRGPGSVSAIVLISSVAVSGDREGREEWVESGSLSPALPFLSASCILSSILLETVLWVGLFYKRECTVLLFSGSRGQEPPVGDVCRSLFNGEGCLQEL